MELNAIIQAQASSTQRLPILCLHGHPGSKHCMSVFTQHLSNRFPTIAPDLRGYGESQTRQAFTMTDHLSDLEALCDRLDLSEFILLGWSLGGILAMELALRDPDRVKGLILVATAAHPWSNHPRISWQDNVLTGIASLLNLVKPGWQWNIETFGQRSLYRYLIQQHRPSTYQYLAKYAVPAYFKTSGAATRALNRAIQSGYNRQPDLYRIQCPALVLVGECDRHITSVASLETAKALANSQSHCYPNVAHLFPWEIPTEVLADIDAWLMQNGFAD